MLKQINHTGTETHNSKHNTDNLAINKANENITKSNAISNKAEYVPIKRSQSKSKRSATPSVKNDKISYSDDKEVKNKPNDKTNDTTTVQIKLGHNLSASHLFANRLNKSGKVVPYTQIDYTRAKERLIKDYLSGISMEHCSNKDNLQKEKEELYKNYENNSKTSNVNISSS